MTCVTIYMEGGGNSTEGKKRLREGMNQFLRELREKARKNRWRWRLVPCGSQRRAYKTFSNARDHAGEDEIVILLVDAEAPVTAPTPAEHLRTRRGDGWDLSGVGDDRIHLMVQTMETWLVADPDALADYYGQDFRASALPSRQDLEAEDKTALANALKRATRQTRKGRYHKIHHAAALLRKIDPAKVCARCRHCQRLFSTLETAILGNRPRRAARP